ncbi:hypothetical protein EKO04_009011 [Ascochyta lentis]|uniref:C2H2-type domain-containing protein n=1 Tax=Ascochyta lentis TaxID=205686 RepID=A0A8H7ME03_9PLEO|nr:hypothetical protein EKO04_009011 [Ascochyta lentis]
MDQSHWTNPVYVPLVVPDQAGHDSRSSTDNGAEHNIDPLHINSLNRLPEYTDRIGIEAYHFNNLDDAPLRVLPNTTEGDEASTWSDQNLWMNMYSGGTPTSFFTNDNVDSTALNQLPLPYNMYQTSNFFNESHFNLQGQTANQPFPTQHTSEQFHNTQNLTQNVPLKPNTSYSPPNRLLPSASTTQSHPPQLLSQQPAASNKATPIGTVLLNGKFTCPSPQCVHLTFARTAELRRHHTTRHAQHKPEFWCEAPLCPRGVDLGGKPFHRSDKLAAHVRSMHSSG